MLGLLVKTDKSLPLACPFGFVYVSTPATLPVYFCLLFVRVSSSLQHFLCFYRRLPEDVGGSLKPGAFPTCQPGSKRLKEGPESPQMCAPSPESPARSNCQPNSPSESNTCNKNLVVGVQVGNRCFSQSFKQVDCILFLQADVKASPDPKACNWKKYKYIVLNPLCAATSVKEEDTEEPASRSSPTANGKGPTPNPPTEEWSGEVPGQIIR